MCNDRLGIAVLPEISVKKEIAEGNIIKINWMDPCFSTKIQLFWHKKQMDVPCFKGICGFNRGLYPLNG
ncbi:hypothetical protein ACEQPO_20040 [Bacillus sp. SL00103]